MFAIIGQHSIVLANTIADGFQGTVRKNVTFDPIPEDYDLWPEGSEAPQHILGEFENEPGHYRLFKYARDLRGSGFRLTGKYFGGLVAVYPRSR